MKRIVAGVSVLGLLLLGLFAIPGMHQGSSTTLTERDSSYISKEAALSIARQHNNTVQWSAYLDEQYEREINGKREIVPSWVMKAALPQHGILVISVDAVTGKTGVIISS